MLKRKLNIYSFHRNIGSERFDYHNTRELIAQLENTYDIVWHDHEGSDMFRYQNDSDVLINQGSIVIFEFDDTKQFKTFDFGDAPTLTMQLSKSKNFIGAAIGQYNKQKWDEIITDLNVRNNVVPSVYPETCWNLGVGNYEEVQTFRSSIKLDERLHWRGSIYKDPSYPEYYNIRRAIELLATKLPEFNFGKNPIAYDYYLQESMMYKVVLGFGGGGGYTCGDFCLRDIEMFGLGIPMIRPTYAVETKNPLIPNVHYIAVDAEFDEKFFYKNPDKLADDIKTRYYEVIHDDILLQTISNNAREWYLENAAGPIITSLIKSCLTL